MTRIGPGFLALPPRQTKPRTSGFTHVLDKGLSLVALDSLLATAGESIDFLKLGWGTAYVSDGVKAKVALCRSAGVNVCLGGTMLEICVHQHKLGDYVRWLRRLGISHVEVSDGALGMPVERKRELIRSLSLEFWVLSEVGSKNPDDVVVASDWVTEMAEDLQAGASLLIAEARESGTVGIYLPSGEVRCGLVESIIAALPADRIIFEAPRKDQQAWFIRRLGTIANLGNIAADEVVALETLRLGLRSDTLDLLPPADDTPAVSNGDRILQAPSTLLH
ncbi:MAG: phosphosulfolactate synthase [Pseudonocardiaceae bacterium]